MIRIICILHSSGLIDAGLLRLKLGIEVDDRRVGLLDLGLRFRDRGLVVAGVDLDQQAAGLDKLVVGDGDLDDGAGHLGADAHIACVDKGVVRRFVIAGMQPPHDAPGNHENEHGGNQRNDIGVAAQQTRRMLLCGLLVRLSPRPVATTVVLIRVPLARIAPFRGFGVGAPKGCGVGLGVHL